MSIGARTSWRMNEGRWAMAWLALAAGLAAAPASLTAQDAAPAGFREIAIPPLYEDQRELNRRILLKNQVLLDESGAKLNESRGEFDAYYNFAIFARMTRLDQLAEIPDRRAELARDFSQVRSVAVRAHLVTRTAGAMKMLYEGNFHPGVRFNAMLVLGDLDQEPAQLVYQKPPVPYRQALEIMEAAFTDPNQIEPVRVAALLGIHRHAQFASGDWPKETRDRVSGLMTQLLKATPAEANRSEEGHAWMQRRAIEILATIGDDGNNGEIVNLIRQKMVDARNPMSLRLTAAENIGKFKLASKPKVNELTGELAALALTACQSELDRVAAAQKREKEEKEGAPAAGGGMYDTGMGESSYRGMGMGMPGMGGGGPVQRDDEYKITSVRRRIKYQLNAVQLGIRGPERRAGGIGGPQEPQLGGIGKVAAGPEQETVKELAKVIGDILTVMDDADVPNLKTLTSQMKPGVTALQKMALALGPKPAVSDDPLGDDLTAAPRPAGPGGAARPTGVPPAAGRPGVPRPNPAAGAGAAADDPLAP